MTFTFWGLVFCLKTMTDVLNLGRLICVSLSVYEFMHYHLGYRIYLLNVSGLSRF